MGGPGPWHNKVGDYWNQQYQDEPVLTSVLSVIPVYPFVYFITIHNDSELHVTIKGRKWVVTSDQGDLT
jgi:hypothetical protein